MLLLREFFKLLSWLLFDLPDPRTDGKFGTNIVYPIAVVLGYALFVLEVPKVMKKRKAYGLERIMTVYNLIQIVYCSYIAFSSSYLLYSYGHGIACEPVDYSTSEKGITTIKYCNFYYYLKVIDLLDTVFMVLRKKSVSFLHCYHHGGMIILSYIGFRYLCGGQSVWVGIINCYIHIVMYFYYLLCSYNKGYKASIWWKKHLTQLQLLQFSAFVVIYGQLFFRERCGYPLLPAFLFLIQTGLMLLLFSDFYYKAYVRRPKVMKVNGSS